MLLICTESARGPLQASLKKELARDDTNGGIEQIEWPTNWVNSIMCEEARRLKFQNYGIQKRNLILSSKLSPGQQPWNDFKMAEQSQTKDEAPTWLTELPAEIQTWTKDHVRQWALNENLVDADVAEILHNEDIDGASLLLVSKSDLRDIGIKLGPTKRILCKRDELVLLKAKQLEENKVVSQCNQFSRAYPFNRCHDAYRYTANSILEVTETGPSRYIEPCHEFKAFIHTEEASAENKMKKFTDEALRFAAACMNSRTNGTIHFGVGRQEPQNGRYRGSIKRTRSTLRSDEAKCGYPPADLRTLQTLFLPHLSLCEHKKELDRRAEILQRPLH
ncbi:hypothetical protein COCON_G00024320 [Conger conger]|uniref:SAM domain-containing protein n=1 Tax=Conger conger TaxID=82655 RepID=A0A9Q1DXE9_CONCO|nr:hypothetical protein COCON_G00024320 [Conger conger]